MKKRHVKHWDYSLFHVSLFPSADAVDVPLRIISTGPFSFFKSIRRSFTDYATGTQMFCSSAFSMIFGASPSMKPVLSEVVVTVLAAASYSPAQS